MVSLVVHAEFTIMRHVLNPSLYKTQRMLDLGCIAHQCESFLRDSIYRGGL